MGVQVRPNAKSGNYHVMPVHLVGRFTLNGASNPTVVGGCIASVQRLATSTPTNFFRVTLSEHWKLVSRHTVITASVRATADNQDVTVHVIATNLTDAGGDVFEATRDIDLIVRAAGSAVTTAGLVVDITIDLDQKA